MKKIIKTALLLIGLLIIIPIAGLIILSEVHNESAHQQAIDFINSEMEGTVNFEDFSISYIRHFPRVHLQLKQVAVKDELKEIITLGTLDVLVNPFSLLKKELNIKKVIMSDGTAFFEIDSLGTKPRIFSGNKQTRNESKLSLNIESHSILVNNFSVIFGNQVKKNRTYFQLDHAQIKLFTLDSLFILTGLLDGKLDSLVSNNTLLFANQPISAKDAEFTINRNDGKKVLNSGYLQVNTLKLFPRFQMSPFEDGQNIDLHISGEGSFDNFLELFEFHTGLSLIQTNPDAELRISYNQVGFVNPFLRPYSELDFEILNAYFTGETLPFPLENIHLYGNYNNGEGHSPETVQLEIDTLHAEIQESFVDARFKLKNLNDPWIDAHFISSLEIGHLFKQNDNINLKGLIEADLKVDGRISELKAVHLEGKQVAKGTIEVRDLELFINDKELKIELTSGSSLLNNHFLEVTSLVGAYNEKAFHFHGIFENLGKFILTEDENLGGSFFLNFDSIDLRDLNLTSNQPQPAEKSSSILLLEGMALEFDITGNEILSDYGTVANLRMKSRIEKNSVKVNSLTFNYQDGFVSSVADLKLGNSGVLELNADIKGLFKNLNLEFPQGNREKHTSSSKPLHLPDNIYIGIDIQVERGNIEKIPLQNLQLIAAMNNDEIFLKKFVVDIFDGHAGIDGRLKIDSAGIQEIQMNGALAFDEIDLGMMMTEFGIGKRGNADQPQPHYPEKILLDVDLKIREIDYKDVTLKNFSTHLKADEDKIIIHDFYADLPFGNLSMDISALDYRNDITRYEGTVDMMIDSLNLDKLLALEAFHNPGSGNDLADLDQDKRKKQNSGFPENIDLTVSAKANQLSYKNASLEDMRLLVNYSDEKIDLEQLSFMFSEGSANAHGYIRKDQSTAYPGYLYSKVDSIDLGQFFRSFDNFNQDVFTADNTSGKISWASHYYFSLDRGLIPQMDENLWLLNFIVNETKLEQVKPIEDALFFVGHKSKDTMFIQQLNINAIIARDKLYFRDVLMNNNIANLDVFGQVNLGNKTMDLGLEISLSDLFFRSKKNRMVQTQEGIVNLENDAKVFLNISGPLADHKLNMNTKRKFKNSRDDLQLEIKKAEKDFREKQNDYNRN